MYIFLHNLVHLNSLKRYRDGLPLCQEACQLCEEVYGPIHTETAKMLARLANIFYCQKQFDLAVPVYKRVRSIWQSIHDAFHPQVIRTLKIIAECFEATRNYDEAMLVYVELKGLRIEAEGYIDPDVAETICSIGYMEELQGHYDVALAHYEESLDIYEQFYGNKDDDNCENGSFTISCTPPAQRKAHSIHLTVGNTLSNIANIYDLQGSKIVENCVALEE